MSTHSWLAWVMPLMSSLSLPLKISTNDVVHETTSSSNRRVPSATRATLPFWLYVASPGGAVSAATGPP